VFKKVVVIFGRRQGDRILELTRRRPQDIRHLLSPLSLVVGVAGSGTGLELELKHVKPHGVEASLPPT
jgi:hypothetical protein